MLKKRPEHFQQLPDQDLFLGGCQLTSSPATITVDNSCMKTEGTELESKLCIKKKKDIHLFLPRLSWILLLVSALLANNSDKI